MIRGERTYRFLLRLFATIQHVGLLRSISLWAMEGLRYIVEQAWKARLVAHWRLSPPIDEAEYDERETICRSCPHEVRVLDVRKPDGLGRYCGACGCRKWKWSELRTKNKRRGHNCPEGKHRGSKATAGGCKNCGGGIRDRGGTVRYATAPDNGKELTVNADGRW